MADGIIGYLQLFGIHGECTDPRFPAYIPVLNWRYADGNSAAHFSGAGGGAGKVTMAEIQVESPLEMSSPKLQECCASGRHIKSGKLVSLHDGSVFFRATFEDLLVGTYQLNSEMSCTYALTFRRIETTYDVRVANATVKQIRWSFDLSK